MAISDFQCSICTDDHTKHLLVMVDSDKVCLNCFKEHVEPLLQAALKYEAHYPVRWGNSELKPFTFARLLPAGFIKDWIDREKEYQTPPADRLYCPHRYRANAAHGEKHLHIPDDLTSTSFTTAKLTVVPSNAGELMESSHIERSGYFIGNRQDAVGQTFICSSCRGVICGRCTKSVFGEQKLHCCQAEGKAISSGDTFHGLRRGEDYQICPNTACGQKGSLEDGCNHITCRRCRTNFSYVCAEEARSGHWGPGSACSRYNQPGDRHALFDEHGDVDIGDFDEFDGDDEDVPVEFIREMEENAALEREELALRRAPPTFLPPDIEGMIRLARDLDDLNEIVQDTWRVRRESGNNGGAAWTGWLLHHVLHLGPNLRIAAVDAQATHRLTLQTYPAGFLNNHERLEMLLLHMTAAFQHYPRLQQITHSYNVMMQTLRRSAQD